MAYDGWIVLGGTEIINVSRTAQLAEALGVDEVWIEPESVQWIEDSLGGGLDYDVVTTAPWYHPNVPASAEFAGVLPLSLVGLDDSTTSRDSREFISDGGNIGRPRDSTLSVVGSAVIVATTDRGAEYGKNWFSRMLNAGSACGGVVMLHFKNDPQETGTTPETVRRRRAGLQRGLTVTRKRNTPCSAFWFVNFTLGFGDPHEYGLPRALVYGLGGATPSGMVETSGSLVLHETPCPVFEYRPVYDPLNPALVDAPAPPEFFPDGWGIEPGMPFTRFWVRTDPTDSPNEVPYVSLASGEQEARRIRLSIWPVDAPLDSFCDPLFTVTMSYLPATSTGRFIIDGETQTVYLSGTGASLLPRRADSLVFGPDATPLDWTEFEGWGGLLVTLDVFHKEDGSLEGAGNVLASVSLTPKSI